MLKGNGDSAGGGILILVSDGKESNDYPTMSDVTPGLVSKGVVVHTVLLTNEATNGMIQLAADTNGRSFYDSGLSVSTELLSAFRSSVTGDDSAAPGAAPVEVGFPLCRHVADEVFSIPPSVGIAIDLTILCS